MGSHGGMGNLGGDGKICLINDHREAGSSSVAAAVLDQPRCPMVDHRQGSGWGNWEGRTDAV